MIWRMKLNVFIPNFPATLITDNFYFIRMKKLFTSFQAVTLATFMLLGSSASAQLTIGSGADLFVASGETLSFDGISFTPSSGYTFSNTTLTRTNDWTISPGTANPYLKKYFTFSNAQSAYSGTIAIDHGDIATKVGPPPGNVSMSTTADLRLNLSPDGTTWTVPTAGTITSESVSATISSPGSNLKTFAVALTTSPLPVSLLSFSGKLQSNGVLLNWVTASEQNSSHFDVERSGNGRAFSKIGEVAAAGNSNTRKSYEYLDGTPLPKASWYRLKSVDVDGTSAYSQILPITRDAKISSYPNPVSNQLQLQLSNDWNGTYELVVFDLSGRTIMNTQVKAGSYMFDCSNWASGIYNVVMYQDKQQVYAQRIVKK